MDFLRGIRTFVRAGAYVLSPRRVVEFAKKVRHDMWAGVHHLGGPSPKRLSRAEWRAVLNKTVADYRASLRSDIQAQPQATRADLQEELKQGVAAAKEIASEKNVSAVRAYAMEWVSVYRVAVDAFTRGFGEGRSKAQGVPPIDLNRLQQQLHTITQTQAPSSPGVHPSVQEGGSSPAPAPAPASGQPSGAAQGPHERLQPVAQPADASPASPATPWSAPAPPAAAPPAPPAPAPGTAAGALHSTGPTHVPR
eukprot:m.49330 g.49330  ORF g.49330 m.49330 type:complete len:252 (+) comp6108_c0_seq1:2-757(+)